MKRFWPFVCWTVALSFHLGHWLTAQQTSSQNLPISAIIFKNGQINCTMGAVASCFVTYTNRESIQSGLLKINVCMSAVTVILLKYQKLISCLKSHADRLLLKIHQNFHKVVLTMILANPKLSETFPDTHYIFQILVLWNWQVFDTSLWEGLVIDKSVTLKA